MIINNRRNKRIWAHENWRKEVELYVKEAKKFEKEIRKKKTPELKDILHRQNALLQNHKIISSLPDKGEKVRQTQTQ